MAQLRQDYEKFVERKTAVIVVGPENAEKFSQYFTEKSLPFIGLPDPTHGVLKLYGQQVKIFKFGRMPAQLLIDKEGVAQYIHYGHDMKDIPANEEMLDLIDMLEEDA